MYLNRRKYYTQNNINLKEDRFFTAPPIFVGVSPPPLLWAALTVGSCVWEWPSPSAGVACGKFRATETATDVNVPWHLCSPCLHWTANSTHWQVQKHSKEKVNRIEMEISNLGNGFGCHYSPKPSKPRSPDNELIGSISYKKKKKKKKSKAIPATGHEGS
jgi:hypothetical protein